MTFTARLRGGRAGMGEKDIRCAGDATELGDKILADLGLGLGLFSEGDWNQESVRRTKRGTGHHVVGD